MQISNLKVGASSKKAHFPLHHDVQTTSDFGFCQPTLVRHLVAGSSGSIDSRTFVRLAPLPVPTFGRIKAKTITSVVPINEVFEAFDYLQSQQAVQSALASYIPTQADNFKSSQLWNLLVAQSLKRFTRDNLANLSYDNAPFLNFTLLTPSLLASNIDENGFIDKTLVPIGTGAMKDENTQVLYTYAETNIRAVFDGFKGVDTISVQLWNELCSNVNSSLAGYFHDDFGAFTNDDWRVYSNIPLPRNIAVRNAKYVDAGYRNFGDAQNCDFFISVGSSNVSLYDSEGNTVACSVPVVIGVNLTRRGQRLMKVLNACGISFDCERDLEVVPMFAYYKAWFDKFNPGRDKQWRDTYCYKLIHSFYDTGVTLNERLGDDSGSYDEDSVLRKYGVLDAFFGFLDDLSSCFYTLKTDNITATTPYPLLVNDASENTSVRLNDNELTQFMTAQETDSEGPVFQYGQLGNGNVNSLAVKGLLRLYSLVNKNSVIGSKIEDYLKTKYGYSIPRTTELGTDEYYINIDDISGTVNNDNTYLGEYAGRGVGSDMRNDSKRKIKFDVDRFSILVQMFVIVPQGGYVQAYPRQHINRFDFYQPEFDSLGMDAVRKSEVFGRSSDVERFEVRDSTFGFLPRYFSEKIQNNLHNGDFMRRATRSEFLPYSLDRVFTEDEIQQFGTNAEVRVVPATTITPNEYLRYIGKDEELGNYDRIFYDIFGVTDNFIVHMVNIFDYYAPMKPISESFETFDKEVDDNVKSVEKA